MQRTCKCRAHYLLLTTCALFGGQPYHLPLTTYHLPLTTNHLPPTTNHLPLTTYHLLGALLSGQPGPDGLQVGGQPLRPTGPGRARPRRAGVGRAGGGEFPHGRLILPLPQPQLQPQPQPQPGELPHGCLPQDPCDAGKKYISGKSVYLLLPGDAAHYLLLTLLLPYF